MRNVRFAAMIAVVVAAASMASAAPSPLATASTVDGRVAWASNQLQAAGIDPAVAVVQTGLRNYAGPSCPGAGWTCAPEGQPVIQAAPAGGSNSFECTGSSATSGDSCTVVQTASSGDNIARCVIKTSSTPVTQTCSITQTNEIGGNTATINLDVSQSDSSLQSAAQAARVIQSSVDGNNRIDATQRIFQSAEASGLETLEQTQTGTQVLETDQRSSGAGNNTLISSEALTMRANTSQGTVVIQRQNAASTQRDQRFDTFQLSDGGGANSATLAQKIDLQTVAYKAPVQTTQHQGTQDGGQGGALNQNSTGLSTATITQTERHHAVANLTASQTQFGPHICCDDTHGIGLPDPRLAASPMVSGRTSRAESADSAAPGNNQQGNPSNSLSMSQSTEQKAGVNAMQDDFARGYFTTSGLGSVQQKTSQNGVVNSNSCTGSTCDTSLSCINGACDTTAPDTTIDSAPAALTSSNTAAFTFSSGEAGVTFQCALDSGAFTACSSPKSYSALADGSHTFQVRAVDGSGNADATPATHTWTVDTTAPDTTITSAPPAASASRSATFAFTATETATFECSLDGSAFEACASPQAYSGLADGAHTFWVMAIDTAGNADASPASHAWTIDATPPETAITDGPGGLTPLRTASFSFTATEAGSTFACSLDGSAFTACTSPKGYSELTDGSHSFAVRATDVLGNTDPTPASRTWTVDGTGPTSNFDPGQDGEVYLPGDPIADPQITGTAADGLSGVARVTLTFTPQVGNATTRDATLTCNGPRTSCTWTVSMPSTPGTYRTTKHAVDTAGNVEPEDEEITFTVLP